MDIFSLEFLEHLVEKLGYVGIFLLTTVESTFVPIPAEVTVIPAGALAAKGVMSYWLVIATSTLGVIAGSAINYWLGYHYGRKLILRYGKYVFMTPAFLDKTERFFAKYGKLAVFLGRVLPGVKHYIAFAAGIAKMEIKPFLIFSALGGLVWMWLLVHIGYMAEISAEKGTSHFSSLEIIAIAITAATLLALFVKQRMMKH